jgi:isopenicillin-N epimerase
MNNLAALFLLTPEVVFLNHGSFGATPRPVFEVYQAWQRRLERQPVQFMTSELEESLFEAREKLGAYVHAHADDLVYVPNATFGLNIVARSLALAPGDEVLATDHEYGACNNVWEFMSLKRGFRYVRQAIPMPFASQEEIADQFWGGVSPATKVIFISHITSPTAARFPAEQICARAKQAGILTVVDGAHTVGQIVLDMGAIDADFYLSNGHKWLCSPKGSAFLYTRRERQPLIEPLVVGWGWGPERNRASGSDYVDYLQYLGTNDLSSYLAVPAAIAFQEQHNWTAVRQQCHALLSEAITRICDLTRLETVYPDNSAFQQMAVAPLPQIEDLNGMKKELLDKYGVEIPLIDWKGRHFIRLSIQGYNTREDVDVLLSALESLLPRHAAL